MPTTDFGIRELGSLPDGTAYITQTAPANAWAIALSLEFAVARITRLGEVAAVADWMFQHNYAGEPEGCTTCPLAVAINDLLNLRGTGVQAIVDGYSIGITAPTGDGHWHTICAIRTPMLLERFIRAVDEGSFPLLDADEVDWALSQ